jgi:hypothetical protein
LIYIVFQFKKLSATQPRVWLNWCIDLACKKDFYLTPAKIVLERRKLGAFL